MTSEIELRVSATRKRVVLAVACAASFLVVLDSMIVAVSLPAVAASLYLSDTVSPWLVNAYTLTFAGLLLLAGRCVDIVGRWLVLAAGAATVAASSLLAGCAADAAQVLAWRAVQGVGAALMMPAALALVNATYVEVAARSRALGLWSSVAATGAAAGPVIGGVVTQQLGWRWVFWVNVPVAATVALTALVLGRGAARTVGDRGRLDVAGAVLGTGGLIGVVFATMRSSTLGWAAAGVVTPLVGGLVLFGIFLAHQSRWSDHPLVPRGILRERSACGANIVMFWHALGFVPALLMLSFVMQYIFRYPPMIAGLGFAPIGAGMVVGGRAAGEAVTRVGPRVTAIACTAVAGLGLLCCVVGLVFDAGFVWSVALPGTLFGLGAGGALTPITVSATEGVAPDRQGGAAGLLNTTRQTSTAIGVAVVSAVAAGVGHGQSYAAALGCAVGFFCAATLAASVLMTRSDVRAD